MKQKIKYHKRIQSISHPLFQRKPRFGYMEYSQVWSARRSLLRQNKPARAEDIWIEMKVESRFFDYFIHFKNLKSPEDIKFVMEDLGFVMTDNNSFREAHDRYISNGKEFVPVYRKKQKNLILIKEFIRHDMYYSTNWPIAFDTVFEAMAYVLNTRYSGACAILQLAKTKTRRKNHFIYRYKQR